MSSNLIFTAQAAKSEFETTFLMNFNNNLLEVVSGTTMEGKNITYSNDASISGSGSSLALPGNGNGLTFTGDARFAFGLEDFTMEFFHYAKAGTSGQFTIANTCSNNGGNDGFMIGCDKAKSGIFVRTPARFMIETTNSIVMARQKPYHVAYSREAGVGRLFVDGQLVGEAEDTNNYTLGQLRVGPNTISGMLPGTGNVDDLRVTKGARYTKNFASPTAALTV